MSDYVEPTQAQFDASDAVARDVISTAYTKLNTKAGSVIRELVVRPIAYLHSWLTANIAGTLEKSSVSYLKTSSDTDNEIADAVASNYFVERRSGTRAKGVITIKCSTSIVSVDAGAKFAVDDVTLITEQRTVAMSGGATEEKNGTLYVPLVLCEGYYYANIPVSATGPGKVELEAGADAQLGFANSYILEATLSSPVTGGSDTETDAEMMERCRYSTAEAGIGSYYGLRKKLDAAPLSVIGIGVVAGEDEPLFDARYNSVNINPGGFVDCHVRTQVQAAIDTISGTATRSSDGKYSATLSSYSTAGAFSVTGVVSGERSIPEYTVSFGSSDSYDTARGARFGTHQTITVTFPGTGLSGSTVPVTCTVRYMPGIGQLQDYMNLDTNRFVGQGIRVKAAVPAVVKLDCVASPSHAITSDILADLRQIVCDTVNSLPVGARVLNFSDIRNACSAAYPGIDLRLPCTMSASIVLMSGKTDSLYSNTGLLDIGTRTNSDAVNYAICFFSLIPDNVRIDVI